MPMEDGVNEKPLGSELCDKDETMYDAVGYWRDNPAAGLQGVTNDRRSNNPVRRDKPYGR